MNISIVILSWNGLDFLKECVPSVIRAVEVYGGNSGCAAMSLRGAAGDAAISKTGLLHPFGVRNDTNFTIATQSDCEIILIDNGSSDESAEYVRGNFPGVKILFWAENFSFTKAMNKGIGAAKGEVVIALNNDVIVEKDFIAPLVKYFGEDNNVFAVGAKMLFWDRKTLNFGRVTGDFRYGFFRRVIRDRPDAANSLYACAGGMALAKDKFLKLGGFDEDYEVYWEDLDLCYRAWRQGWRTVYEPGAIVYHKFHGTNLSKYKQSGIDHLSGENYTLFVLKNILDKGLFWRHILFTPWLMLLVCLKGKPAFAKGMFQAFKRKKIFLSKRGLEKRDYRMSDREILEAASG